MGEYEATMSEIHDVGNKMGKPTNILPCGTNVSNYQNLPVRD